MLPSASDQLITQISPSTVVALLPSILSSFLFLVLAAFSPVNVLLPHFPSSF